MTIDIAKLRALLSDGTQGEWMSASNVAKGG